MIFPRTDIKKQTTSLSAQLGILLGFTGIMIGAFLAFHGIMLGHSHLKNGILFIDSWKSLGIDMGITGGIIGVVSALFGIMIRKLNRLKPQRYKKLYK